MARAERLRDRPDMISYLRRWIGSLALRRAIIGEAAFVAALFLGGALLRTLFLTEYPPGLHGDESWVGLEAKRVLEDGWIGIWTTTEWGQPTGSIYWASLFFRFLPDDVATLRLSQALLGALTIPVFYLFARQFFGKRAAAIGAVLLTFSFWHIHYSRSAFRISGALLLESTSLFLLGLALQRGKLWLTALAGLVLGLGVYTLRGINALFLTVALTWVVLLVTQRPRFKDNLRHLLAFWLPAVLVALPMIDFVISRTGDYRGYVDVVSIFNSAEYQETSGLWDKLTFLLGEATRATSTFFVGRHADYTDGLGEAALLDPLTMGLFAVGLAIALWRWRDWRYFLLVAGFATGVAVVAASISDFGENRRSITALPMIYAAAGIAGARILAFVEGRGLGRLRLNWFYPALAAAILFATLLNVPYYFRDVGRSDITKFAYAYELSEASGYLRRLDDSTFVYFYSDRWAFDYEARRFQAPGLSGEDRSREFGRFGLDLEDQENRPVVFMLLGSYQSLLPELRSRYPDGQYVEKRDDEGRFLFGAFYPQGEASVSVPE